MLYNGKILEWPYPIEYGEEKTVDADVLVLGGGIAGCWSAISAARKGAKVALVEKGNTKRSGSGGPGIDHWNWAAANPCSKISPDEYIRLFLKASNGYGNGMTTYINLSTNYETLLDMESLGGKVRDTEDEFKGADFRDEETKLLFNYDYKNRTSIRVWGANFKPLLYKECKRLGVQIYDRVMATSLLTEGGQQGARVIGSTGLNVRTGKYYIFKAKATILCMAYPSRNWTFSTELRGLSQFHAINRVGNGNVMAWKAGAELTLMEMSMRALNDDPYQYPQHGYGDLYAPGWYAANMVDAKGKEIPWVDVQGKPLKTVSERYQPVPGGAHMRLFNPNARGRDAEKYGMPRLIPDLIERIEKGEFTLPLYTDLTSMPDEERRVIWGVMIGNESQTKTPIYETYSKAGYDPTRDLLQSPIMLRGGRLPKALPQERLIFGGMGGLLVDWELKTTLEGLYAAGEQIFGCQGYAGAASTGRWVGRKAADYALKASQLVVDRAQVEDEKKRVYAPIHRDDGMDWKELSAGLCRVMQNYCSEPKNDELLNIGLIALKEIEEEDASTIYADNPHKLMRSLDTLDILTIDQIIMHACLARKASCQYMNFFRLDYPEMDPPEWHKFITTKLEDGKVKVGEIPIDYYEPLKENFEAHRGS